MTDTLYKTIKYQLYPNAVQRSVLNDILDLCRQVFNYLNGKCIDSLRFHHELPSFYDLEHMITDLKSVAPELYGVYAQCLEDIASRIENSYKSIVSKGLHKNGLKRHPVHLDDSTDPEDIQSTYENSAPTSYLRFRGKGRYDSFTYIQNGFWFCGRRLHLSPIGDIRYRNRKRVKGVIKTCTVKRNLKGEWFAYIIYEPNIVGKGTFILDKPYSPIGIDLGLKNIATLSDGMMYANSRKFEKMLKIIENLQRRMSVIDNILRSIPSYRPCKKISKLLEQYSKLPKEELTEELKKLQSKYNMTFIKFNDVRKGEYNRITAEIVKRYDAIAIENINIRRIIDKQMKKGMRISFSGAAWGKFINMLEQKAECAAVPVIKVNPYNTSRKCSHCGNVKPSMSLSSRTYYCIHCGHVSDRDVNAAINILKGSGLRTFRYDGEPEALTS